MNPFEEYIAIIHNRQQDPLPEGQYGEVHHIIPKSCGGCNKKWNLVKLTPEEHYRCHELLPFIYATGEAHKKMVYAWNMTCNSHLGSKLTVEEFGKLKREYSELARNRMLGKKRQPFSAEARRHMSEAHVGKSSGMAGRHLSKEHKDKLSIALTGRISPTKGKPAWNRGIPRTEETKRKISETKKKRRAS